MRIAVLLAVAVTAPSTHTCSHADEYRATDGLVALYDFSESEGPLVKDQSGAGSPIHLKIADPGSVRRSDGRLQIQKPTIIQTQEPPVRLLKSIKASGEISLEAWIQPLNTTQAGPARLATISRDSSNRNFTLGQDGDKFDARLRTTKTSTNGIPSLQSPSGSATIKLTHVIYTHQKNGTTRIYFNGKQVAEDRIAGNLSNWDQGFRFALGNEISGDRPWLGTLHLVAIYSRALAAKDVTRNFTAGPNGKPSPELIARRRHEAAARHFELTIAPILARHCVECHDAASHENGLNLSVKAAAFKGGENGKVILPGDAAGSPLWAAVESGSMPSERPPLSSQEKAALKKWIDDGATWTLAEIDPAVYAHGSSNEHFVQRLTVDEYIESVRAAVGVDISREAREILPRDLRADGFSNTAYNLNVDLKHIDAYGRLAEIIVSRMDVRSFVSRFSKRRRFTDNDMGEVISGVGHWLLRGPVDEREVIAFRGITTTVASAGGDFDEALGLVIEAMLQSPRFIYRVESQTGDGSSVFVGDYELASRLSYIIWGGPPDDALLKAAEDGRMQVADVREHAARMLQDARAVSQSRRFASDWLNLDRLQNLRPNAKRFPQWNSQLATDMRLETLAYFEDVVWSQKKPLSALMNTRVTFATPALAKFYGLDAGAKTAAADGKLDRYDLSRTPGRGGILTQGSLLTIGGDHASMVTRGLLVMHELLRGVVKDPPPCVDTTPIPTKAGLTQRSIALERINNVSCGGCHSKFEPLAFGLEKFDGIGARHDKDEHGNKLRDDGEILFPGAAEAVKYESSERLMQLLAESKRVRQSLTWKVTQFALGRPLVAEDAATVDEIDRVAQANGGTWTALVTAVVTSDLVLQTRTEDSE